MPVWRTRSDLVSQSLDVHLVGHTDSGQSDASILSRRRVLYRQLCAVRRNVIDAVSQDDGGPYRALTSALIPSVDLCSGQVESVVQIGILTEVRDALDRGDETCLVLVSCQVPFDPRKLTEQHEGDLHVVGSDNKQASQVDKEFERYVPVSRVLIVYTAG